MGTTPHLVLRGTTYYFRMAVPLHLVKTVGRAEVSASLRTIHRKQATLRCRYLSNSLDMYFEKLMMGQGPSFEEIDVEIKAYFLRALNWSLEFTDVLMDDPTLDREYEAADMPEKIEGYKGQIKSGKFSQDILNDAQEVLAPLLPVGDKADLGALRHASRGVLRARMEQIRRLIADLTGAYEAIGLGDALFAGMSATDYPPFGTEENQSQAETLQSTAALYRAFKEVRGDTDKALADFDVTMRLAFEVIPPEKPIRAVNDADVRSLRDLIATVPPNSGKAKADDGKTLKQLAVENKDGPKLGFPTQEKRLRCFMGMLSWADNEGHIDKVPGAKVSVSAKKNNAQTGGHTRTMIWN